MSAADADARARTSAGLAVFLLAAGTAWNAGNVGAVVGELTRDLDISLASAGALSGAFFLGFSALGTLVAPAVIPRLGIVRTMLMACGLASAGNVLFAISDSYALLAIARVITGFGLGFGVVAGPVFARSQGGVGMVALFGAAIQLGIAMSLGAGALLVDADVDWRIFFGISAVASLAAVPFLLAQEAVAYEPPSGGGFARVAVRSARVWRLGVLFISIFSVPLILGSWLVHFLSVDNALAVGTAGALSFVLFGVSAAAREAGGALAERGVSLVLLIGGAPWLAAAGLGILALDDSLVLATIAVIAAGVGFALPYGPSLVQAQKLYPKDPAEPVALMALIGTLVPVPLIPWIGSLLDDGHGTAVFLTLGAFVAFAGVLNLRPVSGTLERGL